MAGILDGIYDPQTEYNSWFARALSDLGGVNDPASGTNQYNGALGRLGYTVAPNGNQGVNAATLAYDPTNPNSLGYRLRDDYNVNMQRLQAQNGRQAAQQQFNFAARGMTGVNGNESAGWQNQRNWLGQQLQARQDDMQTQNFRSQQDLLTQAQDLVRRFNLNAAKQSNEAARATKLGSIQLF